MPQRTRRVPPRPDFSRRAERYDELRPVDENWNELYELLVRAGDLSGRRVLDVGCGTGRFAAALAEHADVCGVDPSREMLAVAKRRSSRARFEVASAEQLPLPDRSFERAVLWLVVHLVDRGRAFGELRRVLDENGRIAIATFDPSHFDAFWLNRLFPSLEAIDRARFPVPDQLETELRRAGFGAIRRVPLRQQAVLDREAALERIRGRHISTFDLLDDGEYRAGLALAERVLPETIGYAREWVVVTADA